MMDDLEEARQRHVHAMRKAVEHIVFGEAFGPFPRAGIAKAAGPQREPLQARQFFDPAIIEEMAARIVDVQGDRAPRIAPDVGP